MSDVPVEPGLAQYPPPRYGPPSSGPPSSGPPSSGPPFSGPSAPGEEQPAPPRSRRPLLLAGIGLVVAAAAAVVALTLLDPAPFGGTVLDRGAVERDVAGQFQQREGVAVTLTCPQQMEVRTGGSYRCTGTTATGERVPIRIVVTDASRAAYSWSLR
jgi:hypothetical protein